ncbi:MAG: hypothetical protein HY858_14225 [Candidatus Solibacter usitatus]|nr:hypothetical protein [Candidatus Solibacter usitatus]
MVAARAARKADGQTGEQVKWLADENLDNAIVRGLLLRVPGIDIVRAQDVPQFAGRDDLALLT